MTIRHLRRYLAAFILPVLVMTILCRPAAAAVLLGGDQFGNLISIDTNTGAGTLIGNEPNFPLGTEIEFDSNTGILYGDEINGNPFLHTINVATGLSTGIVPHVFGSLNGMEFVGNTLYATHVTTGGGVAPSTLEIVNTATGALTLVGPTSIFSPISGLAYQTNTNTMFGVTAGAGPAQLVTLNLGTGTATPIAPLIDAITGAQLDHVGSIEFASDGMLYGGMGLNGNINPGWLFSINTATGLSTFIGPTGLAGITGLTDPTFAAIPEPTSLVMWCAGLAALFTIRRKRR